jgi:hypothetical protein
VEGRVTLSKSDLITFVPGAPGPKPLATAAPSPAATTAAPTAAPTGAGALSAPGVVTVDLTGKIDAQGTLQVPVEVVSSDGRAKLSLAKGTKVLDSKGQPVKSITVTPRATQPGESKEAYLSGLAYDFGNITVRPLATLTISYDPPPATVSRINPNDPQLGGFWEEKKLWVKPKNPVKADLNAHTVSGTIGNPATFIVLFWYTDITPPVS